MKKGTNKKTKMTVLIKIAMLIMAMTVITIASLIYFKMLVADTKDVKEQEYSQYTRHYAFIADNLGGSVSGSKKKG